jgi:uncharacterized small protein (DUF1192 family)
MNVLLHLGMPKCGSSALQTYLSSPTFAKDSGGRCAYVALHAGGKLLWGDALHANAAASPFGYCSSHMGNVLSRYTPDQKRAVQAGMRDLLRSHDLLVLSCEGWGANHTLFFDDCLFDDPAFQIGALAWVRPQIEWMNSAWWQWGAWSKASASKWIQHTRPKAQWHTAARAWSKKPWVKQVGFRLLEGEIVQDFMGLLGYPVSPQASANESLPASVLRLFQRNRSLRPGVHDSAIEFSLARHLRLGGGKTPWILRQKMVERLLKYYRKDNEALLAALPADQGERMRNNPLWWDASAYAERTLSTPTPGAPKVDELEALTVAALETIARLDAQLRRLESDRSKDEPGSDAAPEASAFTDSMEIR